MGRVLTFDTNGNEKQKEVARLWADTQTIDILYGGSKGSGKSYLGCMLLTADALTYPGTFYFTARRVLTDLIKYTIPSYHEVFEILGLSKSYYKFNGQHYYFEFYNGSRIYLLEAAYRPTDPRYERFGSMQMTRGWIEEGGEFHPEAKANLQATVGRWKNEEYGLTGKLLITCNPSTNFLFTDYYIPWKKKTLPDWRRFVQALPIDNKMLPEHYVRDLLRVLTPTQIQRLVHGEWEFDDDPHWLVDYDAVQDLFTNDFVSEGSPFISTDLAGKGRDKWVVGLWKGLVCRIPIAKNHSTGKEMEETLKKLAIMHNVPRSRIVSDADGLGFYLESYMEGIKEFKGGATAVNKDVFVNIKAECAYKLAEYINARKIRIICTKEIQEQITKDLSVLKSIDTNSLENRKNIISKDKMKELIQRSPDYLDMLLMRMYFEVKKPARGVSVSQVPTNIKR